MTSLPETWTAAVDECIASMLQRTSAAVEPAGAAAQELMQPITAAAKGGKRLRAQLLLASHLAHAGDADEEAVKVAAALELFQTAALLHDDVLDDSDTRRGEPAAHRRIAALHRDANWEGDADRYGAAGAILAGDLTLMAVQRALGLALTTLPAASAAAVSEAFVDMADLVTAGQHADMRAAAQPLARLESQHDEILAVMRCKTASYTCEAPLALGALIAGADQQAVARMRRAGVDLGIAFQLRDDLLGVLGTPEVTGKPAGDDIREGKRTLVLWRAWTTTSAQGRDRIARVLGDRTAGEHAVADVIDVIASTDAEAWCESEIASHADRSRRELAAAGLDDAGLGPIMALVDRAVARAS